MPTHRTSRYWFWILLSAGALLRVLAAVLDFPLIYPDEQFQTLEPASRVIYGFGTKTWEWYHATRSWFVPALYLPVLALLKSEGIVGGPLAIYACRLWTAAGCTLMLLSFHRLLDRRGLSVAARLVTLALFALSPAIAAWSAATFSDVWAMIFLWIAMPSVLSLATNPSPSLARKVGCLIGITFAVRLQMVTWAAGLGLLLLLWRNHRRLAFAFAAGYCVPVLAQGLLDWVTWGVPFKSVYKNFVMNLFEGVADMNGRSPWYSYAPWIARNLGWSMTLLLGAVPLFALVLRSVRFTRADALVLLPATLFLLAHMAIGHKETRFLLPLYPALFYLFAVSLDGLASEWTRRKALIPSAAPLPTSARQIALHATAGVATVTAFAFSVGNLYSPVHVMNGESTGAARLIYGDGALRKDPSRCLLLVSQYWIWTRGELMMGQAVNTEEIKSNDLNADRLSRCAYAIVSRWEENEFAEKAAQSGIQWVLIGRDRWNTAVFRNQSLKPH